MELGQPIIAYFAIGNYRVGSSLVHTHIHTHTFSVSSRVIHSFTTEWAALFDSSGATERFSPVTQSGGLSVKHLSSRVSLVLVFVWLQELGS